VGLERGWTAARMRWVAGALGVALVLAQFFRVMSPAMLQREAMKHAFPVLLPVIVLGVLLWRWRDVAPDLRVLAVLLLSICVVARLRRGFEFAEWYQVLLEVPAYLVAAKAMLGTEVRQSL